MTTWYAQNSSADANSANQWNSAPDGSGDYLTWSELVSGDVLTANGKTNVCINVDTTCDRITTCAISGTAGGNFYINTGATPPSLNFDIVAGGGYCLGFSGGNAAVTINGDVYGSTTTENAQGIFNGGSTLTINGSVIAGTMYSSHAIYQNTDKAITVNNGNIINGDKATAIRSHESCVFYNPGASNYIQYPKPTSGTIHYCSEPSSGNLLEGTVAGSTTGTYHVVTEAEVEFGVTFGAGQASVGTYTGPSSSEVAEAVWTYEDRSLT